MKNIFSCLLIILCLLTITSCEKNIKIDIEKTNSSADSEIYKGKGYKKWENVGKTYEKNCVPSEQIAVKITDAIMSGFKKSGDFKDYSVQNVIYDIEDSLWIISYGEDHYDDSSKIPIFHGGSNLVFALSETDGRIVRIWYEE